MPNIAAILKEEIARVARREVRGETEKLKKASGQHRAHIAELKRQVVGLQKQVTQLSKVNGRARHVEAHAEIDVSKVRWSPAKLQRHRERLQLSADKFGRLFGVTGQTVYNWESGTRPGKEHLVMIAKLRKLTPKQAAAVVAARG